MDDIWRGVVWTLGLDVPQAELTIGHMAVRAVVVYVAALTMARLGERRFLSKSSPFDVILAIILGSVVSRAITGSSPFFPTLVAGIVVVGVHQVFAIASFRFSGFGKVIKGRPRVLVRDGEIQWDAMGRSHISENDLRGALRSQAHMDDLSRVEEARLERSGELSFAKKPVEPHVVEVGVAGGVQAVRIRLG